MKLHITLEVDEGHFSKEDFHDLKHGYDSDEYDRDMYSSNPGYTGIGDYASIVITMPSNGCLEVASGRVLSVRRSFK